MPPSMRRRASRWRRPSPSLKRRRTPTCRKPRIPCSSRTSAVAEMTLIEGLRQAMDEELARDDRVFLVGEDVGPRGGVFRATQGLFEKYGPQRIVDSPLAELSIVGVGIGAALYG